MADARGRECFHCKTWIAEGEAHDCWTTTEAALTKDQGQARVTYEAAVAKLFSTEAAQRIVDRCLQVHGGNGLVKGAVVERLYRDVRALRIYEGASEVQRLVIARHLLG